MGRFNTRYVSYFPSLFSSSSPSLYVPSFPPSGSLVVGAWRLAIAARTFPKSNPNIPHVVNRTVSQESNIAQRKTEPQNFCPVFLIRRREPGRRYTTGSTVSRAVSRRHVLLVHDRLDRNYYRQHQPGKIPTNRTQLIAVQFVPRSHLERGIRFAFSALPVGARRTIARPLPDLTAGRRGG